MNQCIGYNAIIRSTGMCITYAYNQVNDTTGVIEKSNIQESFILTDADLISANNKIFNAINNRLNPVTNIVLGSITVNYVDDNNNKLIEPIVQSNLQLATYYFTAPSINGYTLTGNIMQSVTLDDTNPNQTITFIYKANSTTNTTS